MDILYKKIQQIKQKPGMYIGKPSLHLLQAYLNDYVAYHNETNDPNYFFMPEFQEYIQRRFNITTTHSWANIITFYSNNDDDAFNRFYQLLEEFFVDKASL